MVIKKHKKTTPLIVYVVTPSLNKSFKFQSDWPYNNSQVYLISSIVEDLTEDEDRTFTAKNDSYYFQSSVNYPNNKSLTKQNVYVDKNMKITKVEVTNDDGKVQITMNFNKIQYNKKFDKNYFELSELININDSKTDTKNENSTQNNSNNTNPDDIEKDDNNINTNENNNTNTNENTNSNNNSSNSESTNSNEDTTKTKETATIDDVIYPMYLPSNTTLANKEVIDTEDGQRLILTFEGDNPFVLIEETISYQEEGQIIPVSGSLDFLSDVIGVINDNSVNWESNGIEYYIVSNTLDTSELVSIARSISVLPVSK